MIKKFITCSVIIAANILLISTICKGQPGYISTIAGTGTASFSGDGGLAVSADINDPGKVVMDAAGNIYFSDVLNNRVRKISTTGIVTTIAGTGVGAYSGDGGLATSAELHKPYGLAFDDTGNLYIADFLNNRVRKVNTAGIITTVAGNGVGGYTSDGIAATAAELWEPNYVFVDHGGNIYITDNANHRIRKVNTLGIISTVAGNGVGSYGGDGGAATAASLYYPAGICVDDTGNLYIADFGNSRIRKVNTSGTIATIIGTGTPGYSGDGGLASAAEINMPLDVVMDNANNMYIADGVNNRVRKINTSGIITLVAGNGTAGYSGDGIPAPTAEIYSPDGLWVDGTGNIYLADADNNRIRMIEGVNHPPRFTGGELQTLTVCENEVAVPLNSVLAVMDTDAGQTETWTLSSTPSYGTVMVAYATTSTGGVLTPVGLYYTPMSGYIGTDNFKVSVSDGIASDETEIDITVDSLPNAGIISGLDSICPGHKDTLSETVSGGIWSYSNIGISTISFSGVVTGMSPGTDTIIYTVINSCGIVSAIFPLEVRSDCPMGVNTFSGQEKEGIEVFPNPANGEFMLSVFSNTEEQVSFTITNVVGQKVKEFSNPANKAIDVKLDATPGIYFLTAVTKDKRWSEKIIISAR